MKLQSQTYTFSYQRKSFRWLVCIISAVLVSSNLQFYISRKWKARERRKSHFVRKYKKERWKVPKAKTRWYLTIAQRNLCHTRSSVGVKPNYFTGTQEGVLSDQGPWVRPNQSGSLSRWRTRRGWDKKEKKTMNAIVILNVVAFQTGLCIICGISR